MHKVTKDAFTLILFSVIAGIASYLYSFAMARMLSVEEYSLLYSLIALTYILAIPQETIRTVISRYTTKHCVKGEMGKIHWLMNDSLKKIAIFSIILFVIYLLISPLLAGLLHTSFLILAIAGLILLFSFLLPVLWGFFQGLHKFRELGVNNSIEGVIKLIAAILLVALLPIGIRIYGALIAAPISIALAFILAFFSLKSIRKEKIKKCKEKTTRYSLASLIIFGLITLMFSIDVLIARYFFSSKISGLYAAVSLISKSLFFVATGVKRAMMPNLTEKNERKQQNETRNILKKVSLLLLLLFIGAFILSILFPEKIIQIIVGSKYLATAPFLKYMIFAIALFSFSNLLVYYNLSIDRNKKITSKVLASAAFLEIVLLILFHKDLNQFILVLIITNLVLFLAMLIISIIQPSHLEKQIKIQKMTKQKI